MEKLYTIGGKQFFKRGGKFVPVMAGGGPTFDELRTQWSGIKTDLSDAGIDGENVDYNDHSASTWAKGLGALSTTMNALSPKKNPGTSPRALAASQAHTKNKSIETIGSGALGAAAMLDPTGTAMIADAALKVGRSAKNLINPGDEYGVSRSNVAEVAGNVLDPLGYYQQSFNIGKKYGVGHGLLNHLTFGIHGNNLMKDAVQKGIARDKRDEMGMRQGLNQGAYRNDSVYAQEGAVIKPKQATDEEPNVEIEDGEVVLADPRRIVQHGNGGTSLESKYAALFHGDKHGEDKDKDGMEGIPLTTGEAYVASDYLGLNGKRAGKGNKSVASEMKPYVKFLHNAEKFSTDPYKNNPVAIAETNRQLHLMKKEAERNKFLEEVNKMTKSKEKGISEIVDYMINNAPMEDLSEEEKASMAMLQQTQQPQQMNYNRMMARFGGHYMQQGGMAQPEPNPSQDRMSQLIEQTPSMDPNSAPAEGQQLSAEAQQMLQQLPPETQAQIMQLPVEQQEAAIMQAAQEMGLMQPEQPQPGMEQGVPMPEGEMPVEDMAAAQMGMEGGQPVMQCGGRMYRKGSMIKFQYGGKIRQGRISGFDSNKGTMILE